MKISIGFFFSSFEIKNSYTKWAHKMMESSFSWWSAHHSAPQESTRCQCYTVNYAHILNSTTNKRREKSSHFYFYFLSKFAELWTGHHNGSQCVLHIGVSVCVCLCVCVCNASSFSHDEFELLFLSAPLRASTQFVHIAFLSMPCLSLFVGKATFFSCSWKWLKSVLIATVNRLNLQHDLPLKSLDKPNVSAFQKHQVIHTNQVRVQLK